MDTTSSKSTATAGRDRWGLGVTGCVREHARIDTDLRHGALPFRIEVSAEHKFVIGGYVQPAVGAHLAVELSGSPAGIAQSQ